MQENNSTESLDGNEISALLAEYNAMKAEEIVCQQAQVQIATVVFSFITAILGFDFLFQGRSSEVTQYMLLGFAPFLVMFFGCLWIHKLYCHMRLGAYLYHLEDDINRYYQDKKRKMYFEHWIIKQESGKSFFKRTSRLYGYVTFGTWLFSPVLLYFFACGFFPEWGSSFYTEHGVLSIFLIIVFILYCIIQITYMLTILHLKNEKELKQPRI